ncbi:MAG: 5-formyltetrahydrofolate cyclo-ligase [Parasphingorhabdus sp.]|nr:5-formyltetrahydrofolate cyclo-ligase [Parasphingorhabdus sp.]
MRADLRDRRNRFYEQLPSAAKGLSFRRPPRVLEEKLYDLNIFAFYSAVGSEAPAAGLLSFWQEQGMRTALPCTIAANAPLEFREYGIGDRLNDGFANIPEPLPGAALIEPQVIFAPLLGFDRAGNRLGHGGGYYDRSFAKYSQALRIGLAWSCQEVAVVPHDSHDITLNAILTEVELIWIGI